MFALSLADFLSLLLSPRTDIDFFLLKVSFEWHIQNLQKISGWFKIWMRFVGHILIKLGTSPIWGFLQWPVWWPLGGYLYKHAGDRSVTTKACNSPHLTCLVLCCMAAWKLSWAICAMRSVILSTLSTICPPNCMSLGMQCWCTHNKMDIYRYTATNCQDHQSWNSLWKYCSETHRRSFLLEKLGERRQSKIC